MSALAPPTGLPARVPCTCTPTMARYRTQSLGVCPACAAWEHGHVLLVDGTMVTKTAWVLAHEQEGQP